MDSDTIKVMKEYKVKVNDSGTKCWYLNSELHREDGPALEDANGTKYWYQNDKLHREDGPAIEFASGYKAWYINDKELTEKQFSNRNKVEVTLEDIANKFDIDINELRIKEH